jgi:membrane dipeptidase
LLNPIASWIIDEIEPCIAGIVAASLSIDTHNHIDIPVTANEVPGPDIELARELEMSDMTAI